MASLTGLATGASSQGILPSAAGGLVSGQSSLACLWPRGDELMMLMSRSPFSDGNLRECWRFLDRPFKWWKKNMYMIATQGGSMHTHTPTDIVYWCLFIRPKSMSRNAINMWYDVMWNVKWRVSNLIFETGLNLLCPVLFIWIYFEGSCTVSSAISNFGITWGVDTRRNDVFLKVKNHQENTIVCTLVHALNLEECQNNFYFLQTNSHESYLISGTLESELLNYAPFTDVKRCFGLTNSFDVVELFLLCKTFANLTKTSEALYATGTTSETDGLGTQEETPKKGVVQAVRVGKDHPKQGIKECKTCVEQDVDLTFLLVPLCCYNIVGLAEKIWFLSLLPPTFLIPLDFFLWYLADAFSFRFGSTLGKRGLRVWFIAEITRNETTHHITGAQPTILD